MDTFEQSFEKATVLVAVIYRIRIITTNTRGVDAQMEIINSQSSVYWQRMCISVMGLA